MAVKSETTNENKFQTELLMTLNSRLSNGDLIVDPNSVTVGTSYVNIIYTVKHFIPTSMIKSRLSLYSRNKSQIIKRTDLCTVHIHGPYLYFVQNTCILL